MEGNQGQAAALIISCRPESWSSLAQGRMEEQQQARARRKKVAKNWQPAEATVTAPGYKVSVAVEMAAESRERGESRSRRSCRARTRTTFEDDDGGRDGQQKSNTGRKAKRRGQNGAWRHFFRGGVTWRSRSDEKGKKEKEKDERIKKTTTTTSGKDRERERRLRLRLRDDEQEEAEDAETSRRCKCFFQPLFQPA
ncbi:hypothetical protein TEQG_00643 [Trichophyton equinum CBS 127.97]|uniref:Uncharacterized protein n=1 Tax=Trichophyton equinum (strain ATCC MYA-4606 / CBS 127.97) TaxID=559882 RepID=F2PI36_TRIEC|nr:hypothetical protein TEQG_00643 [Trichophyton equinum CBS 127.97]